MGETLKVKAELLLPAAQAIVTSSLAGQPEEINLREGEAVGELSYTALFWNSLYMVCVGEGADGCFQNLENQIEVWNNCVRGLIHRVQFFLHSWAFWLLIVILFSTRTVHGKTEDKIYKSDSDTLLGYV